MDIYKMLAELRGEREHIEEAILTLERLAGSRGHRRGRPPSWLKEVDFHLNNGQPQQSNGGVHMEERKIRGLAPASKKQSAALPRLGGRLKA
jgi:hypothetical protein